MTTPDLAQSIQLFEDARPVDLTALPPADARVMMVAVDTFAREVQTELDLDPAIVSEASEVTRQLVLGSFRRARPASSQLDPILTDGSSGAIEAAAQQIENLPDNRRNINQIRTDMVETIQSERINDAAFPEAAQAPSGIVRFVAECLMCELEATIDDTDRAEAELTLEWLAAHGTTGDVIKPVLASR